MIPMLSRPSISRTLILVCVLILAVAISLNAANPVCAKCKKVIESGAYYEIDGKFYHANHFVCARCSRPIGDQKYMLHEGAYYDSDCYNAQFAPRCTYCSEPMTRWITVDGKDYHDTCYSEYVADRCALCGKPITGPYMYDRYGAKVHAEHMDKAQQCDYCSRLITANSNGGERYSDGRVVCGICLETVVENKREADSLMQVVRQHLVREGIVIKQKKIPLELVSQGKMQSLSPHHESKMAGFTKVQQTKTLYGLIKDNEVKVYILDRMPRMNFVATAAHELMHVWLGLNDRFNTDEILSEGSCNYAAYLVLQRYLDESDYVIQHMLDDPDPVYGEGFRKVKSYAESAGTTAWLEYVKSYDAPPWER